MYRLTQAIAKLGNPEQSPIYDRILSILESKEKIPYVRKIGPLYYNFWQDSSNPRGVLRRTTLESYKSGSPDWEVVLDVDALGKAEGESWVYKGSRVLSDGSPECHNRALLLLSRGGADATVVREFNFASKTFVDAASGGFVLPEAKSNVSWRDKDTLMVGTVIGDEAESVTVRCRCTVDPPPCPSPPQHTLHLPPLAHPPHFRVLHPALPGLGLPAARAPVAAGDASGRGRARLRGRAQGRVGGRLRVLAPRHCSRAPPPEPHLLDRRRAGAAMLKDPLRPPQSRCGDAASLSNQGPPPPNPPKLPVLMPFACPCRSPWAARGAQVRPLDAETLAPAGPWVSLAGLVPADASVSHFADHAVVTLKSPFAGRPAGALLAVPWAELLGAARSVNGDGGGAGGGPRAAEAEALFGALPATVLFEPTARGSLAGWSRTKNYLLVSSLDTVKSRVAFWRYIPPDEGYKVPPPLVSSTLSPHSAAVAARLVGGGRVVVGGGGGGGGGCVGGCGGGGGGGGSSVRGSGPLRCPRPRPLRSFF